MTCLGSGARTRFAREQPWHGEVGQPSDSQHEHRYKLYRSRLNNGLIRTKIRSVPVHMHQEGTHESTLIHKIDVGRDGTIRFGAAALQ